MRERFCGRGTYAFRTAILVSGLLLAALAASAQGEQGITKATTEIKTYFGVGIDLMYAIGGIVGLVGAIKVYNKWSAGEPDTSKVASAWFGACIFLVVVATVLKAFFKL